MATKLLPILTVSGIGAILLTVFLSAFKLDQKDLRTKLYILFMMLLGGGAGLWLHYGGAGKAANQSNIYLALQAIFLALGIGHVLYMYAKLFWSKRNALQIDEDSFWPELVYTLAVLFLMTGTTLAVYGYFNDFDRLTKYLPIGILFILPFLFIKSFDFLNQIPQREFSLQWFFTNEKIKEDQWHWVNEIWIQFNVRENWEGEQKKSGRKANFRIHAPRKVPLREVFRLAVREYNRKGPEISLQDLGFEEENTGRFWWLFSIKFELLRPSTWFRKVRYLDPYSSPVLNEIRPKDIIVAKRMSTNNELDEEYIPTGELQ